MPSRNCPDLLRSYLPSAIGMDREAINALTIAEA